MARPRSQLHEILKGLIGDNAYGENTYGDNATNVYFQPKPKDLLDYPCFVYSRDNSFVARADNVMYYFKKRYSVIYISRNPDSPVPDLVEELPLTKFDRFYIADGLNHFAFKMYF
jgi:hypothetical protein